MCVSVLLLVSLGICSSSPRIKQPLSILLI